MKVLLVGGAPEKESGVMNKLFALFEIEATVDFCVMVNGYDPEHPMDMSGFDLILWWPDVSNALDKKYPVKDKGAVLICSKVMRKCNHCLNHPEHGELCNEPKRLEDPVGLKHCKDEYCPGTMPTTRVDAVSRIFKMHGNAVVAITKHVGSHDSVFEFELIDALNNTWHKTTSLPELVSFIMRLYSWTKASHRVSLEKNSLEMTEKMHILDNMKLEVVQDFLDLNKELALKVAEGCGNRFFGNFSTRCTKLFPSTRKGKDYFFFSRRNVDKKYVGITDIVLCDHKYYYDDNKPSVDTPVQLELYKHFPAINFMIHGHAYIKGAKTTTSYCPCGDMREVKEVVNLVDKNGVTKLNLLNHGFLLMAPDLEHMRKHFNECSFKMIGG